MGGRGTPADEERLRQMEDAILRLREAAEKGTVVVEGQRDLAALDWLGIGGQHVAVHRGRPLETVVEELARQPGPIILLLDWDRTGGLLRKRISEGLQGRQPVDDDVRRRLATSCHCRSLEELPAELTALRRAVAGPRA